MIMKRIFLCVFIFLSSITTVTRAQNSPVLTLEHVSTTASKAIITITAAGFENICAGDLKLLYNPEVAVPKLVTVSSALGGTISTNLSGPGIIRFGWFTFPGVTLSDGSVIFSIEFEKVNTGKTIISFDGSINDKDCQFYNGLFQTLVDAPFSTYYIPGSLTFSAPAGPVTTAPSLTAISNENIDIPVTVSGFNNVGGVSLRLEYNPDVLQFISSANTGGFPGMIINNYIPGIILVSAFTNNPEGYSLPDGILFTLNFKYKGGTTELRWNDEDGTSCEYAGPQSAFAYSDIPQQHYYIHGRVGTCLAPDAPVLDVAQPDCENSTGKIIITSPIGDGYTYSIDEKAFQSSPIFDKLEAGNYNVTVMNEARCVSAASAVKIENQPPTPPAPSVRVTQPSCTAGTGMIEITSPSGQGYFYSIDGSSYSSLTTFRELSPNNYRITVKNDHGCISNATLVEIDNQPIIPVQPEVKVTEPDCGIPGTARITNYNDSYSYTFNPAGPAVGVSGNISGFTIDQVYTVTATNNDGCESIASASFSIKDALSVPARPVIAVNKITNDCEGGFAVLTSDEAFSYEWSTGETTQSISVFLSGSYTVKVTNEDKCSATSEPVEVSIEGIPEKPSIVNCWDEYVFNPTTCQWDNTGVKPVEPAVVNCWDDYQFNTVTCEWENMGTQPEHPAVKCYQSAIWNPVTCAWDVTDQQPEVPATACWEMATWNETTCSWDITGTQPAMPETVNCWDEFEFNATTCQWENKGNEPLAPIIIPDGPLEFCSGENVNLSAGEGISYLWSTGETTQSIQVTSSGDYTVKVLYENGCYATSLPVVVSVVSASDLAITSMEVYPENPVRLSSPVHLTIDYTSSIPVEFTVTWEKGVVESYTGNAESSLVLSHTYQLPGLYEVKVEAKDACGNIVTSIYEPVVVYQPSETFVTGGGWFNSSLSAVRCMPGKSIFDFIYNNRNAYKHDPHIKQLIVKAHFSFTVRHQINQTAPAGNVQFNIQKGGFNFSGNTFDWMVIIDDTQVIFQGSGTINGSGNYGFLISAVDGGLQSADGFRIKIWDKDDHDTIIYDNLTVTEIKGSVEFHTPHHKKAIIEQDQMSGPFNHQIEVMAFPNPFSERCRIQFISPEPARARVDVFDINGRSINTIFNDDIEGGIVYYADFKPENYISSIYFYRIRIGDYVYNGKIIYKKDY